VCIWLHFPPSLPLNFLLPIHLEVQTLCLVWTGKEGERRELNWPCYAELRDMIVVETVNTIAYLLTYVTISTKESNGGISFLPFHHRCIEPSLYLMTFSSPSSVDVFYSHSIGNTSIYPHVLCLHKYFMWWYPGCTFCMFCVWCFSSSLYCPH